MGDATTNVKPAVPGSSANASSDKLTAEQVKLAVAPPSADSEKKDASLSSSTTSSNTPSAGTVMAAAATETVEAAEATSHEAYNTLKVNCVNYIMNSKQAGDLTDEEATILLDLALAGDQFVLALYTNFSNDRAAFSKYAKKKATALIKDGTGVLPINPSPMEGTAATPTVSATAASAAATGSTASNAGAAAQ